MFFDETTKKITILNWDRGQLPLYHVSGFEDGTCKQETLDKFTGVYGTYGKRLINGFKSPQTIFAVDTEALLNCLL